LSDVAKANPGFSVSLLRYFNPVGAHESGLIRENPNELPNNLMPFITQISKGKLERLRIFGNDEDVNGIKIQYETVNRRQGDIAACFAEASKVRGGTWLNS
jgi:UDP-glucose 4-epimerase